MKECTKCKIEKDISEFSKNKESKDGLRNKCRSCSSMDSKKYRQENSEKVKEYNNKYRQENIEYCKELSKKYRQENSEKVREQMKQWREENAKKLKEYSKQYRHENFEKIKEGGKKYLESKKDGKHYVYYLPDHNYVGTTNNLYNRMHNHRSLGRNTDNYQILASFEERGRALRFESIMHDSGFEGKHCKNLYH